MTHRAKLEFMLQTVLPPCPKSRLPGPLTELFFLEPERDLEQTVQRDAHDAVTVSSSPAVEWVMTEACR